MADGSEYIECLKHLVEIVLEIEMTDEIVKALNHGGWDDIEKLGLMEFSDIKELRVEDPSTKTTTFLNEPSQRTVKLITIFLWLPGVDLYNHAAFMKLKSTDWDDFLHFQRTRVQRGVCVSVATTDGGSTTPTSSTSTGGTATPATLSTASRTLDPIKKGKNNNSGKNNNNGKNNNIGTILHKERIKDAAATKPDKAAHNKGPMATASATGFATVTGSATVTATASATAAGTVERCTATLVLGKVVPAGTYVEAIEAPQIIPTTDDCYDPLMPAISTFCAPVGALTWPSATLTIVDSAATFSDTLATDVLTADVFCVDDPDGLQRYDGDDVTAMTDHTSVPHLQEHVDNRKTDGGSSAPTSAPTTWVSRTKSLVAEVVRAHHVGYGSWVSLVPEVAQVRHVCRGNRLSYIWKLDTSLDVVTDPNLCLRRSQMFCKR